MPCSYILRRIQSGLVISNGESETEQRRIFISYLTVILPKGHFRDEAMSEVCAALREYLSLCFDS